MKALTTQEIYTSEDEEYEINVVEGDSDTDDVDSTEYYSEGGDNEEDGNTTDRRVIPPTPPRPRDEMDAFHVFMSDDEDDDIDFTEYYTESEDEGMDVSEWVASSSQLPKGTDISYSDDAYIEVDDEDINSSP